MDFNELLNSCPQAEPFGMGFLAPLIGFDKAIGGKIFGGKIFGGKKKKKASGPTPEQLAAIEALRSALFGVVADAVNGAYAADLTGDFAGKISSLDTAGQSAATSLDVGEVQAVETRLHALTRSAQSLVRARDERLRWARAMALSTGQSVEEVLAGAVRVDNTLAKIRSGVTAVPQRPTDHSAFQPPSAAASLPLPFAPVAAPAPAPLPFAPVAAPAPAPAPELPYYAPVPAPAPADYYGYYPVEVGGEAGDDWSGMFGMGGMGGMGGGVGQLGFELREIPTGMAGTRATIEPMGKLALEGSRNPEIVDLARAITRHLPNKDYKGEVQALYWWVRDNVRYVQDPRTTEWVTDPYTTIFVTGVGDCDDHATVMAALGLALGHGAGFRTVAADPVRPEEFSHVYAMIGIRERNEGFWVSVDTTTREAFPGWDPPESRVFAIKDWVVAPP